MSEAERIITRLVLKTVDTMPTAERPKFYRALASLSSDDVLVAELFQMAADIDAAARRQTQMELRLDASASAEGKN